MRYSAVTGLLTLVLASTAVAAPLPSGNAPASFPTGQAAVASGERVDAIVDRVVDHLWKTSDVYWHEGDYARVIGLTRVIVEADPAFSDAWGSGAWLMWSLGDTPAADAFLEEGVRRNPNRPELFYEYGWHLFNTKRYAQALPLLQRASGFPTASAQVWKILAHTYDKLGRLDESEKAWRTVVERFPNDVAGPRNLQRVQEAIRRRDAGSDGSAPKP